jgi:hypothetical protein
MTTHDKLREVLINFASEIQGFGENNFQPNDSGNKIIDSALSKIEALMKVEITPEQLHKWYLEATLQCNPESYNLKAQKCYEHLTEEQKSIDKYIAHAIVEAYEKGILTTPDKEMRK